MAGLVRRDTFADLVASLRRDLEMFRSAAEPFGGLETITAQKSDWLPAADVLTKGDDLILRMELPGIDPERDIEITVENGMLRIHGQRREKKEEEDRGYIRRETSYGSFERVLRVPSDIKAEDLKANYSNGILEVVVPKAVKRSTQRVPVLRENKGE